MGKLESKIRTQVRRNQIQKYILGTVAAAGVLSVALLAPNVIQALNQFGIIKSRRQKEIITNSRKRLINAGLLQYRNGYLELTKKGESKLRRLELADFKFKRPKRWDGKWRVLIFDVKEKRRLLRDKIRLTLKAIGFAKLQYSVWVYPYDCEDLMSLLKIDFQAGKEVIYMVVDQIENDKDLKAQFNLK